MKRVFCLLLAASLFLLTGCFGKSEGEETSSENPAPTSSTVGEGDSSFIPASLPPLPDVHLTFGKIVNIIEGSYANVRSAPDQNSEPIGRAYPGDAFLVDPLGSSGDWVKVTYEGQSGFIFQAYISVEE